MMWRKLLTGLVAAAALAASAAAANVLHRGNQNEPDTLDPARATGSWESNILGDLFLGLTTEGPDAQPIPGAAVSWTVSPDGLVWTFKLREGAVWSDGVPVTADDFVFSLRRTLDPATASEYASILYVLKNAEEVNAGRAKLEELGARAIDPLTLELTLSAPAPFLPQLLMHTTALPTPRHVVEQNTAGWTKPGIMVTNGPFVLAAWVPNDHVRAVKNPRFYDAASVALDEVMYYPTDDAQSALKRFRTGTLDLNVGFPAQQFEFLRETMAASLHVATVLNTRYIVLNTKRKPFDDPRVRLAIAKAIDRDVIARDILRTGEQPAYSLVPPGTAGYGDGPKLSFAGWPMERRLNDARLLLEEAGFSAANPLRFRFNYIADNDSRRVAAALQEMWKRAGIEVELVVSEKKVHYNTVRLFDYDVAESNWFADYNDAKNFLFLAQPSSGPMNSSQYSRQAYEDLVRASDQEQDPEKRAALMKQAEAMMLEDAPLTPVYFGVSRNLVQPWVKGFEDNLLNVHRSRFITLGPRTPMADTNENGAQQGAASVTTSERPWYWWAAAAWNWFLSLLCSWFGVACPAG